MTNETKWSIDPVHSQIEFKVKHLMIAHVKGRFKIFDASIYSNHRDFSTAEVALSIDTASIDTGNVERDDHLKSDNFLDAAHHKTINFTSPTIGKADKKNHQELWGELTIKGITKVIKLDVVFGGMRFDARGSEKAGFAVTGVINRNDWGLSWNTALDAGGTLIGEEVNISCEIELVNMGDRGTTMVLETNHTQESVAVK